MIWAELACAWAAGVALGWRLGLVHRRVNGELHHWIVQTERPPYDWAGDNTSKQNEPGPANA